MIATPMWRKQLTPCDAEFSLLSEKIPHISVFLSEKHTVINSTIPFTRDIKQLIAAGCFPPSVSTSGLETDT